jgi:hypothetical protein
VQTEVGYLLEKGDRNGIDVFIVMLSTDKINFKETKIKFLWGLGYAIYVAAFDLDEASDDEGSIEQTGELDTEEYCPKPLTSQYSNLNLLEVAGKQLTTTDISLSKSSSEVNLCGSLGMGVWGSAVEFEVLNDEFTNVNLSSSISKSNSLSNNIPIINSNNGNNNNDNSQLSNSSISNSQSNSVIGSLTNDFEIGSYGDNMDFGSGDDDNSDSSIRNRSRSASHSSLHLEDAVRLRGSSSNGSLSETDIGYYIKNNIDGVPMIAISVHAVPTWDPVDVFNFAVGQIPVSCNVPNNLTLESFTDVRHVADGSNSNVYLARLDNEVCVIKMIKEDVQLDPVAVHEFDVEHGMLSRLNHPNIIKLLGAGRFPRRFIVLECLTKGTLDRILNQNQSKPGIAQKLFRRPSFSYGDLLSRALSLAEALDYLHSEVYAGSTIIHRGNLILITSILFINTNFINFIDIKPDNVGFSADGTLKLFDFGLCTCVKSRTSSNQAYEMTGNTGSLRYMAPEVALRKPYTEKADIYSFGIMFWQMARDRIPFKGMTRDDFMKKIAIGGERLKLDKTWPLGFTALLTDCWHSNPSKRPSFAQVTLELHKLLAKCNKTSNSKWSSGLGGIIKPLENSNFVIPPPPPSPLKIPIYPVNDIANKQKTSINQSSVLSPRILKTESKNSWF